MTEKERKEENQLEIKRNCYKCGDKYDYDINNNNVKSNISLNRLDNNLPHITINVELMCVICNKSESNTNQKKIYNTKDIELYNENIKNYNDNNGQYNNEDNDKQYNYEIKKDLFI